MTAMPVLYATTETGERVGFDMCFAPECLQPIARCACDDGPTPPRLGTHVGYESGDSLDRRVPAA